MGWTMSALSPYCCDALVWRTSAGIVSTSALRVEYWRTRLAHHRIRRGYRAACNVIQAKFWGEAKLRSGVTISKMKLRDRRPEIFSAYRRAALTSNHVPGSGSQGFDVPETEVGIIAASTAGPETPENQRLGRVLRPVKGKDSAVGIAWCGRGNRRHDVREEETDLDRGSDMLRGVGHDDNTCRRMCGKQPF